MRECPWPSSWSRPGGSPALESKSSRVSVDLPKPFCSKDILDITPKKLHERCPVFMGSKDDVEEVITLPSLVINISCFSFWDVSRSTGELMLRPDDEMLPFKFYTVR